MSILKFTFVAFLLFIINPVGAAIWQINKDHSELFFQVPYLTVSEVTGRFNKFSGKADFPDGKSLPSQIQISIETDSLDTGNRQRDGHLKSQEFLRTKTHPQMTFESKSISQVKPGQLRAEGTLSLAGVSKPFTIDFELTEPRKDTWNYESRFARFRSKINRKEFRIVWNKTLTDNQYLVGEEITFWGTFQLQPMSQATPASKHMIPDTKYIREREKLIRGEMTQDEYDQLTATTALKNPSLPSAESKTITPEETIKVTPELRRDSVRDRTLWQLSFVTLGIFGFFASIVIGLWTKKIVSDRYPEQYREGGLLGILTDFISIPLILLYALALWEVGWG